MSSQPKILVVSWNTNAIRLCESTIPEIVKRNRSGWGKVTRRDCSMPDFFPVIADKMSKNRPELVVFGFVESIKPGDYFFSEFLRDEMPRIGYKRVAKTRMSNVGLGGGIIESRNIRIAVYARSDYQDIKVDNKHNIIYEVEEKVCNRTNDRTMGGKAIYLTMSNVRIALIVEHLPFDTVSLTEAYQQRDKIIRQNYLNYINICFNNIYNELVYKREQRPDFVILFGDLGYYIYNQDAFPAVTANDMMTNIQNKNYWKDLYMKYDELKEQTSKNNVYALQEGVNNEGPLFLPTCNMSQNRPPSCDLETALSSNMKVPTSGKDCFEFDRDSTIFPSWCTRILYQITNEYSNRKLVCTTYDRFDYGETMRKAKNAGVYAILSLN